MICCCVCSFCCSQPVGNQVQKIDTFDKMKQKWQRREVFEKTEEELATMKLLEDKIGTRLNEIKKEGKKSVYFSFVMLVFSLLVVLLVAHEVVSRDFFIAYAVVGASLCLYTLYVQTYLGKVDVATMNVETVSAFLLRYRKRVISGSLIGGLVSLILVVYFFVVYADLGMYLMESAFMIALVFIFLLFSLWKNNVKKVGDVQRDLKAFA